jgi:simple sugar transport system substrate-binding protein
VVSLRLTPRVSPSQTLALSTPLLALAITVVLGVVLFLLLGVDPLSALRMFFVEPVRTLQGFAELAVKAAPLVLIALGLSVCYRSNVWNIGAEGQYILGAIFAGGVSLRADEQTGGGYIVLVLLAGVCGGMLWAAVVAVLRDRFHANEILVSLMLVYVAELLLSYLVYGPWKDPQGYNFPQTITFVEAARLPRNAHDRGRKAVEAEFGSKVVTSFVENVPESADAERVLRDLVGQGNTLIFGTTFGYMETLLRVASDAPDVKFEHATGYKVAKNVRVYDSRTYEGAYLAGVVAGGMTKSNVLGVVASIPIPEVIRNINSFTLGALSVNPSVKTKVVWINKWFDPPKESEGAQSLLDAGADVLLQNTDSSAVLQTAEKAGKYAFGWDSDMSKFGPKAHLASAVINWAPYYKKAVGDALAGTWQSDKVWWGVKEGAIDLVSLSSAVPADLQQKVVAAKAKLAAGTLHPWTGPIVDQTGKLLLKAGEVATDEFLHGIEFYVKGVEGQVPG